MSQNPFRYFKMSPEIIQPGVMMCIRCPLSLHNVKDLLHRVRERQFSAISGRVVAQDPDGRIEFTLPLAITTELCGHVQISKSLALHSRLLRARWPASWKA